jgi:hypothetical protein
MTQTSLSSVAAPPAGFGAQNNVVDAAPPAEPVESEELSETERLEALLFARTRSHGSLQRELERKDRIVREALLRMSSSTSLEFSALRAGYDAAVARAIEAELARAELTFTLDETRAQLTATAAEVDAAVDMGAGVGAQHRAPSVYANGVDLAPQARPAAVSSGLAAQLEAMRGELSGVRARALEAEAAWQSAHALTQKLQQRLRTAQTRVDELRSETAELTLLAQTRAARIAELTQVSGLDQQEIRAQRAQIATATTAQIAQGDAREADRQLWSDRFSQQEEREQAAWKAASEAVARSESRLREFLVSLEQPLKDLDGALDALSATESGAEQRAAKKSSTRAERPVTTTTSNSRAAARALPSDEPAANTSTAPRLKNTNAEE